MASFVMALSQLLHDMDAEYASNYYISREVGHLGGTSAKLTDGVSSASESPKDRHHRSPTRSRMRNKSKPALKTKRQYLTKFEMPTSAEMSAESDSPSSNDDQTALLKLEDSKLRSASLAHWLTPPIAFTADGSAFVIHDTKRLEAVLPRYFGTNVYRSFHRQLNMYSFHSLTPLEKHHADLPTSAKVFRHQYFHRDADEATLAKIRRKQSRMVECNELVKWEPAAVQDMSSVSSDSSNVSPVPMVEPPFRSCDYPIDGEIYNESQAQMVPFECPVWGIGPPAIAWPLFGTIFDNNDYAMMLPPPGSCRLIDVAPPPPEMIAYYLSLVCQPQMTEPSRDYKPNDMYWADQNPDIIQIVPTPLDSQTVM